MRVSGCLVFLCVALVSGTAGAGPDEIGVDTDPTIYGGTPVETCGWPTTVAVQSGGGLCTGTLVHPQIVIYAAHCGAGNKLVAFGESIQNPGRTVGTEFCQTNPQYSGTNHDFAFCKLGEPITDIEITPILMGCETAILSPGRDIVLAGFGQADNGPTGIKREVTTFVGAVGPDEAVLGGNGVGACHGDSGGPAFIKLTSDIGGDDTWRVFGVTSRGPQGCLQGATYGLMHTAVEWIEGATGVDITPCHDVDGTWNPSLDCRFFPKEPDLGHGSWPSCGQGPTGGFSSICGPPAAGPDDTAPEVEITAPESGAVFESDPDTGSAAVPIEAVADDADGWGVEEVRLTLNGEEVANGADNVAPYAWPATFPPGQYTVTAIALDYAGNEAESAPVYFGVDMEAPVPDDGGTDGDSDGDTDDGTGTGAGGGDDAASGCGCSTDPATGRAAPLWAGSSLLGVWAWRRRRRGRPVA